MIVEASGADFSPDGDHFRRTVRVGLPVDIRKAVRGDRSEALFAGPHPLGNRFGADP
jgi:hypothetical protein